MAGVDISLPVMNRVSENDSAFFISFVYSLLPKYLTIQNLFILTAAGAVPCGGRKTSRRADYIFSSFGIIEFIYSHFENRILLKPVLGGVASFAHFIIGHE